MPKRQQNALILRLQNDPELAKDPDRKMLYISMARLYIEDLQNNLSRTSMELEGMYMDFGVNYDQWREFLFYPLVKTYIDDLKSEKMLSMADKQIMSGENPQHALKVKEDIRKRGGEEDRSNFVVFFLPDGEIEGGDSVQKIVTKES